MNAGNEILEEIWRVREEIARESNHDIHAMAEAARTRGTAGSAGLEVRVIRR